MSYDVTDFDGKIIKMKFSRLQKLRLHFSGCFSVGDRSIDGWTASLEFFVAKCPEHGYFISYLTGHDMLLNCPKCFARASKNN